MCRYYADILWTAVVSDLYQWRRSRGTECGSEVSVLSGLFLLESWYPEYLSYDHAGTGIFRQSRIFRCHRDGGKDRGQPDLCAGLRLHGNLF